MRCGYHMQFQNEHAGLADAEFVRNEMKICEMIEPAGFDILWCVEHHFNSYSMLPDSLQALAYLAGRTRTIQLGSAGVVLPWNDPLRVAEKVCMLDALCNGRFVFGMARGLSRREYRVLGIDMEEARGRFDESAKMILAALETGVIEGAGPFYKQLHTEIRPRPSRSFKDRIYAVAMSPESVPIVAELGATMMYFNLFDDFVHVANVEAYRGHFLRHHHRSAPPVHNIDVTFCDRDKGRAEAIARDYIARYYVSVLEHYELLALYHKTTKGYESHGAVAEILKAAGKEKAMEDFVAVQACGTPQQILDRLETRRKILGPFEWSAMLSFGGLPYADVASSVETLGKYVLPEIATWS